MRCQYLSLFNLIYMHFICMCFIFSAVFSSLVCPYTKHKNIFYSCRFCTIANFIFVFMRIKTPFWQKCVCENIGTRTTSQIDFLA